MDDLKSKVAILPCLKGEEVKVPGKYACLPVSIESLSGEGPIWIVDVYAHDDYPNMLLYVTPTDYTERCVESCGHSFFFLEAK